MGEKVTWSLGQDNRVFSVCKVSDTSPSYSYNSRVRINHVDSVTAVRCGESILCSSMHCAEDPQALLQIRYFPKGANSETSDGVVIHIVLAHSRRFDFLSPHGELLSWTPSRRVTVEEVTLVAKDGKSGNYVRRLRRAVVGHMQSISFRGSFIKHKDMSPYIGKEGEVEFLLRICVKVPARMSSLSTFSQNCRLPAPANPNSLPNFGSLFLKERFMADCATNLTFVCSLPEQNGFEPKYGTKEGENWVYHVHREYACRCYADLQTVADKDEDCLFWLDEDLLQFDASVNLKHVEGFLVLIYFPTELTRYLESLADLIELHSFAIDFNGKESCHLTFLHKLIIQHILGTDDPIRPPNGHDSDLDRFNKTKIDLVRAGVVQGGELCIDFNHVTAPPMKDTKEILRDLETLFKTTSDHQLIAMETELSRMLVFLKVMELCPLNLLMELLKKYRAPASLHAAIALEVCQKSKKRENGFPWNGVAHDSHLLQSTQDQEIFGDCTPAKRRKPLISSPAMNVGDYGVIW